jgi:hypothetical protein
VIHRTFRSLDDAPKLVCFTMRQWAALTAATCAVLGLIYLARVPTKPALTLCVFAIGLPAALTYVSESGGLQLSVLLGNLLSWRFSRHLLCAATNGCAEPHGVTLVHAERDAVVQIAETQRDDDGVLDRLLSEERWGR